MECWIIKEIDCDKEECSGECEELKERYAKIVYCKDEECMWNNDIPFKVFPTTNKAHIPLGEDSYYHGICARPVLGITPQTIETGNLKYDTAVCTFRAQKYIKGHLDFTRFPQGGRILGSQEHEGDY